MPLLLDPTGPLQDTEIGRLIAAGEGEAAFQLLITSLSTLEPISYLSDPELLAGAWTAQKEIANRHYEPGVFTTFIGFEWTSQPNAQNLHHNVFFRDAEGPDAVYT